MAEHILYETKIYFIVKDYNVFPAYQFFFKFLRIKNVKLYRVNDHSEILLYQKTS